MFEKFFAKLAGKFMAKKVGLTEGTMESKKWYKSSTIWSDILTVVVMGIAVADNHFGTHIASNNIYATIIAILAGMGIKGRTGADTKIG